MRAVTAEFSLMRCPGRTSQVPGAQGLLLLLLLPAPRCSNAFSPCVLLLPSAPERQTPTPCPWPGQDLSSGHDHHFGKFPGAAVQQLYSHTAQAAGDAGGWEVSQAAPFSWDRLIRAGAAVDAKGKSCLFLCFCRSRCWAAHIQVQTSAKVQVQSQEGWGGSQLSPEVTTLTCAFSSTCSSAWERGSCLSPAPLTSEQKHPQGPHHTQEALAAAPPQVISH